jgi:hypothetical protein
MSCSKCGKKLSDDSTFCSNCGHALTTGASIAPPPATTKANGGVWILLALIALVGVIVLLLFNTNTPLEQTQSGTVVERPPAPNPVSASRAFPPPAPADSQSTNAGDHELHLLPNLFGRGAISDGRTYSIALISAYQSKIPPATQLIVQGIIDRRVGPYSLSMTDEQDGQKTLICGMTQEEFQDVTFLYHVGNRVQAMGEYVNASDGGPVLKNCRVSSPTDKVVRLGTTKASTVSTPDTTVPGDQSSLDDVAAIRKAAEQGNADAQSKLGAMYHNGQGLPQDYSQALYWGRKAAEQGYAKAQDNIGVSYFHGQGVPQDYVQAAYWYRKAAEQGFAKAQGHLGVMYYQGQALPQDYGQAYFWMALAASGKVEGVEPEHVEELRDAAASHLTPEELSQAQERVRKWREEHPPT